MARRGSQFTFDLRDYPQLQRFLLHNARPTGRQFGIDGSVEELEIDGLLCAGKKLHDMLVEAGNDGVQNIAEKFVEECTLISDLRHPHIVQFLGICSLPGSELPVLVMEYLPLCLDGLLENTGDIPLAVKLSILCDVARGLTYLHSKTPPIIHRDLTAKNVLLNSSMVAKIVDLGVVRILNLRPGQTAATMTQTPGTLAYMPQEVLEENPTYNTTTDVFSFGHLSLFTAIQVFPLPVASTFMDPKNPGMVVARTEIQRRMRHIQQMSQQLGEGHPLVQLVTQCLHNDPRQRPSASQALHQLEQMRVQIEDPYEHMTKLEMIQSLRERGGARTDDQVTQLQAQLKEREAEVQWYQSQAQQYQAQQYQAQQYQAQQYQAQQYQAQQYQAQLQGRDAEVQWRQSNIQQIEVHEPPHSFHWKQCRDMPFATHDAKTIVIEGKVYIGGGITNSGGYEYIVLVYDPERDEWRQLPMARSPVCWYGMAAVNNQLVLAGGLHSDGKASNQIRVWDGRSWVTPYPPMPTARCSPAAVGYGQFLVVVGGKCGASFSTAVETLDTVTKQWNTATPLPVGRHQLTSAVVGDTLYLLGGFSQGWITPSPNKRVFSISLPTLVSYAPSTWERLLDTPLKRFTAVSLNNSLLAVGGAYDSDKQSTAIHIYNSQTNIWIKVGDLPAARSQCTCTALPSGELLVLGGQDENNVRSNKVYIATVNK